MGSDVYWALTTIIILSFTTHILDEATRMDYFFHSYSNLRSIEPMSEAKIDCFPCKT